MFATLFIKTVHLHIEDRINYIQLQSNTNFLYNEELDPGSG